MKTVLCYGDSNTYGYNPSNGFRYPENVRWTGRLQNLLGKDYKVIEEGCNGRTTVFDDPIEGWKNGLTYLRPCLNSHKPVDIVIMMLGSNDLKESFHATPKDIADGAETLVKDIIEFTGNKQGFVPTIILVAPPEIGEDIRSSAFYGHFYENAIERSKQLPELYKQVAERNGCVFVNASEYIKPSVVDSLHLSPEGHGKLDKVLDEAVRNL